MNLFTTQLAGGSFGTSGKAFWDRSGSTGLSATTPEIALPSGFNLTDTRGSWCEREGRKFSAGVGTDNGIFDEFARFNRLGITAPDLVPVLAAAAGPGTTGVCQAAIAWYDELLDEWSPLSGASNEVALSNQGRTTSNIPPIPQDSERVTHVGVWVRMDNSAWRLSTKRQVGVTSITESVATLALGSAFPATFTRFPRCTINAIYHERLVMAGDYLHPNIVYVSVAGFPERYGGLSFKTENGEPVVCITVSENDVCLVLTPTSQYELRGWRDNDMSMVLKDADMGAINNCGPLGAPLAKGKPIIHNRMGIWFYNGAWHNIVQERQKEWSEFYKANETQVRGSFAIVDPNTYTYRLFITSDSGALTVPSHIPNPEEVEINTIVWRANLAPLLPLVSGQMGQPHWSIDVMNRAVDCAGLLGVPGGERPDVHLGFCDGHVRYDDPTDNDDDGDAYGKRLWIRTKAYDMGNPGGNEDEGKEFYRTWSYTESETSAWTVYFRGGDEQVWQSFLPTNATNGVYFREAIAASVLIIGDTTYVPKTVHDHKPQYCVGRCLTVDVTCPTPLGFRWRGFGGIHKPGRAAGRMPATEEEGGS
jgi:hypothetical protein